MPTRVKRNLLIPLLFLCASAMLTHCASAGAPIRHPNGLSCQTFTSYLDGGLTSTRGTDCRFQCPDGRLLSLPEAVDSQSKDELNFLFCGVPLPEPTAASVVSPGAQLPTATAPAPLLTNEVNSCDPNKGTITFVLAQPAQVVAVQNLNVQIQGQASQCSLTPSLPGLLLCKLPPHMSWPAGIVVRVNHQVVNLFPYEGAACQVKPTAHPSTKRAPVVASPSPKATQPLPTQPLPTKPRPTLPRPTLPPTQPPPTLPPPTQPQPTEPLPTLPLPTQPLPTQPPATDQPAPTEPISTEPPAATEPPATQEVPFAPLLTFLRALAP